MLTYDEKRKIQDILSDGLGINRNINLAYYLDSIQNTNLRIDDIESQLARVLSNQKILDKKLDFIINLLQSK